MAQLARSNEAVPPTPAAIPPPVPSDLFALGDDELVALHVSSSEAAGRDRWVEIRETAGGEAS
jgi:hypothetical protein